MGNLPITIDQAASTTEKRCISDMSKLELITHYAETANMYAGQIRELYHELLHAPLRRADLATAARMSTLITELNIMTGLVKNRIGKIEEGNHA
ncbi:hypothetical protein I2492_04125 [Budviciaceae bacterium CWB-B4]|uniref:Uncharacterized protein n=1 Tax=Limnobaculum xujianqingii TaxID=2738837 RepID=A0A9D7AG80_9GAMM|nr:hypothetical protein [Limnobaculum xujianqingii]MBK5072202.1 hypothetical protein [Limnobaculum xujianqingii]MBK5175511.1 hypothetical protein [Limnobaculum xujianqingii]